MIFKIQDEGLRPHSRNVTSSGGTIGVGMCKQNATTLKKITQYGNGTANGNFFNELMLANLEKS